MMGLEKIRRGGFWIKDYLKGSPVRSHFKEIRIIIENTTSERATKLREQYLSDVISHAVNTTPFYKSIISRSIKDFPVINKNIIRDNFDSFRSGDDNYKSRVCVVTSGSTGTPFSIHHDKRKRERNTADTIYFGELAGFHFGEKLYYFKIWNKINGKSRFSAFSQNIVPYDVLSLNDNSLALIIDKLKGDFSTKGLLAYSSVYDAICFYLNKVDSNPIKNNTKAVIAMSEALSNSTKQAMSYYFNTQAVSRYSNVENGIIAQQLTDGSEDFLINDASFFVELLDFNSDVPVPEGTPGRIVVTDLFNFCMPMIRYDTGDIGVLGQKQIMDHPRLVFKSIEGRRMDMIYNTSGSLVSSFVITNNMWKYREVRQYQFIQLSQNEYLFKINTEQPFQRERELINEFKDYFGEDAIIKIEYVHEIPLLASGKRKKVVNACSIP